MPAPEPTPPTQEQVAPTAAESDPAKVARQGRARWWRSTNPTGGSWAELLSADPLIVHAWCSTGFPLGAASVLGPRLAHRPAHFLLSPASTIEVPRAVFDCTAAIRSYMVDHPLHRFTFLGNTERETRLMANAGFDAITVNQNCLMDDAAFRPLPGVTPVFDAVSNARLSPEKRVELAAETDRLALIYFYAGSETVEHFHAEHARFRALMPHATFVNKLTPHGCDYMTSAQINEVLAKSRVGLCLSPVEGAMKASIEYLFAGLSVVSTPSIGGRDVYFDDEYCLIADPDPRSIRDAVRALVARAVPRDRVRAKTLARVEADRSRYIAFVQSLIDHAGGRENFADRFWKFTRARSIHNWQMMPAFIETVLASLPPDQPA